jgi:hypothetical protein
LHYLVALYERYRCLTIGIILYLFPCAVVESPHIMRCEENGEEMLAVKFYVICVWKMDPRATVAKHLLPLYIYLPAMNEPPVALVIEALREMAHYYTRAELAYRFRWFLYILRRTEIMSDPDKQIVEEALHTMLTYEEIIQDDPVIQKMLAQEALVGEARGEARGRDEGRRQTVQSLHQAAINVAIARFPELERLAKLIIGTISDVDRLQALITELSLAASLQDAQQLLISLA